VRPASAKAGALPIAARNWRRVGALVLFLNQKILQVDH